MHFDAFARLAYYLTIWEKLFVHPADQFVTSLTLSSIAFLFWVEHVDVGQIIEIFAVEPTKDNHAASDKNGRVSSSGFRNLTTNL